MAEGRAPWETPYHAPVLVDEVLRWVGDASRVLDGTLGGGGHAAALLAAGASVDGVDRDPEAVAAARARLAPELAAGRFRAFVGNFAALDAIPAIARERYDGVVLDLGISSHQLDTTERGFSFRPGAPFDMRMDDDAARAADWVNDAAETDLATAFRAYADEPRAARLAREIARRRAREPFATSDDLVRAIRGALGPRTGPGDFARLFQAVRIAVNGELDALEAALPDLRDRLHAEGRLAVITYHSGEDRLVKTAFRSWSNACTCPPLQPRCICGGQSLGTVETRRAVVPEAAEIARNPRARSAKLRVWRRAA
jgi:16S rRNA (cytosine1402-N4)-methyltransferase